LATGDCPLTGGSQPTQEITLRYDKSNWLLVMNLSLPQQFEAEAIKRSIDDTEDFDQLKALARELADLYVRQRAATAWVIAKK
jgi:spore coat polysaccharide biosynthesis protein SpsF (cytidylyltransferase family)